MEETWKDIQGYEGLYQVSNLGNVRSLDRKRWNGRAWCKCKGVVLMPKITKCGYLGVQLRRKDTLVHRLVAQVFIDNPENKRCVNHLDGNKLNNRVENLQWCTHSENIKHAFSIGLKQPLIISGEAKKNHKLNDSIVREIRKQYKPYDKEWGRVAISKRYGISKSVLHNILTFKKWKHVTEE